MACHKEIDPRGGEATPIARFTRRPQLLLHRSLAGAHKPTVNLFVSSGLLLDRVAEHLGNSYHDNISERLRGGFLLLWQMSPMAQFKQVEQRWLGKT